MATVTLTFTDEEGAVNLTADFEPPINRDEDPTAAQVAGVYCMRFIQSKVAGRAALEDFLNDLIDEWSDDGDDD